MGQGGGRPAAARRGGAGPLRGGRPLLPLALRAPLQLRADVGPPRGLDLLGPLRRRDPLRRDGLRRSRSPTARTPTSSPTRPATRRWASTRCGRCATRSPASAPRRCCPQDAADRLRLEDLLGFRRNPTSATPLFRKFGAKALDGHPTPATPFVQLSTGASGVGVASSIGLALGARDYYGTKAPRVHIVEGEGGLTPGPRGRGAGRRRHRLARQRSSSTWTGTRPRSTRTACAARARSPATTCSGPRWSSSTCTTGT